MALVLIVLSVVVWLASMYVTLLFFPAGILLWVVSLGMLVYGTSLVGRPRRHYP